MSKNEAEKNADLFQELAEDQGALQGPISLSVDLARPLRLARLQWHDWNKPGQLKITNTAYTTIVTGHWKGNRPSISGGPLTSPYCLAQFHFHWGPDDTRGSEHAIEDRRYPLEMHVLLYKNEYKRPKIALRQRDGVVVLAYVFEVKEQGCPKLEPLMDGLSLVKWASREAPLCPDALNVVTPFHNNYFLYWGAMLTDHCAHTLAWLVSPTPLPISSQQINKFRQLLDYNKKPITKNFCDLQPHMGRSVFYATDEDLRDLKGRNCGVRVLFPPPPPPPRPHGSAISTLSCLSQQRCCLTARVRDDKRRKKKERSEKKCEELQESHIQQLISKIKEEKRSNKEQLKELERLTKALIQQGSDEASSWYRAVEHRIEQIERDRFGLQHQWKLNGGLNQVTLSDEK